MTQIVYKNRLILYGKITDVISQLKELSKEYKTIGELIQSKTALL